MKRKSFIILFFSISVVLAVFASNRMSVNEIISENVEALSSGDDCQVPVQKLAQLHITPLSWGNDWYGYSSKIKNSDTFQGYNKCGDEKKCNRPINDYCWYTAWVSVEEYIEWYFMYID